MFIHEVFNRFEEISKGFLEKCLHKRDQTCGVKTYTFCLGYRHHCGIKSVIFSSGFKIPVFSKAAATVGKAQKQTFKPSHYYKLMQPIHFTGNTVKTDLFNINGSLSEAT